MLGDRPLSDPKGRRIYKGNPGSCYEQKPGLARRVTAPRTAATVRVFTQPRPIALQWAGALCYLASDASNSTTARAISETMINRLMAVLLFRLAPRRAQAVE